MSCTLHPVVATICDVWEVRAAIEFTSLATMTLKTFLVVVVAGKENLVEVIFSGRF